MILQVMHYSPLYHIAQQGFPYIKTIFDEVEKALENIVQQYQALNLSEVIDYERFSLYSIVHHSTAIEGSTLTPLETQVLLSDGITPKGKPLEHSLMVTDHHAALKMVMESALNHQTLTEAFVQQINAFVMRHTGAVYETPLGRVNASEGAYRKGNVFAGNHYFVSYDKVPGLVGGLAKEIERRRSAANTISEALDLSFDAHYQLVTIHPFYDGNGRTSRLLMNFLQADKGLPMAIVHAEDKAAYIDALIRTREQEDIEIFREFMHQQYRNQLEQEIARFKKDIDDPKNRGRGFQFLFLP